MDLTVPTQLSAFPLTVPPDWAQCEAWFAHPMVPQLDDCLTALSNLPTNEDPITYRPIRTDRTQPKTLLVIETHNTCQLKFHASGKWVEEHAFSIDISPNKIRNMLGRLIEKCVQGEGIGGMVTNGINETMKWILREDTEFPGEPQNLFIPETATFLTAMVWGKGNINIEGFEPGANHPLTGSLLYDALVKKYDELRERDPHSAVADELIERAHFLSNLFNNQQFLRRPPWWTWWGTKRPRIRAGSSFASENGSLATASWTTNATSPGLVRVGHGDCTAATAGGTAGACSGSRR